MPLKASSCINEIETFYGMIESTTDALRIFEMCRKGRLGRVSRRLQEKERGMIRSGSVFVFDEQESGIKRWTDGKLWSPSRILGNFLIYRELEAKIPAKIMGCNANYSLIGDTNQVNPESFDQWWDRAVLEQSSEGNFSTTTSVNTSLHIMDSLRKRYLL